MSEFSCKREGRQSVPDKKYSGKHTNSAPCLAADRTNSWAFERFKEKFEEGDEESTGWVGSGE